MGRVDTDPQSHILAVDPGHGVWIEGISQSCGKVRPTVQQMQPVDMDLTNKKVWLFIWLHDKESDHHFNYGVRIEYAGAKFRCVVRGPRGHVSVEHWDEFPGPDVILGMAMMAGFDW